MTIKELIEKLQNFPLDTQVLISGDPEGNDYRTLDTVLSMEFQKLNNDGGFDAVVIFPTDTLMEIYYEDERN